MGSGQWFRSIICHKKGKTDKSKKVHSTTDTSNGSEHASSHGHKESSPHHANCVSERNPVLKVILTEYTAATRIQAAFRSYKARKTQRRLKGALRFNVLIQGPETEKQATTTLRYVHLWSNIQAQVIARRHDMVTQARITQKKLENQFKLEAKLHDLEVEWCGGSETMEEILSRIQQREEAAIKRERAMAYAFSHQGQPHAVSGTGLLQLGEGKVGLELEGALDSCSPVGDSNSIDEMSTKEAVNLDRKKGLQMLSRSLRSSLTVDRRSSYVPTDMSLSGRNH